MHTSKAITKGKMPTVILRTEDLTKRFPQVVANDSISIDIRGGEIHCLLGENGAGKTTLAECLYGFYKPEGGKLFIEEKEVFINSPQDAIQLRIGMVHQHFILVPTLSVTENIIVGTQSAGFFLELSKAENNIKTLCKEYGVELDPQAKIWQLSVGQQQWVEILKALYVGVRILILDEPTAVLTPQEADKLFAIIKKMKDKGLSIIFITHKLKEVMQISDRVTVLKKGKLVATVDTADVTMEELSTMMVGREVMFSVDKEKLAQGGSVLEINDLHALNDRRYKALNGLNLSLRGFEILGLAGVAGNGQKELFEVLIGVRKAQTGQVIFHGENIVNKSPHSIMAKGIRHIPEDRLKEGLIIDFSVAENLILGQQGSRNFKSGLYIDRAKVDKYASTCISTFEIVTPSPNHITRYLSGGNLQKAILARELSQRPRCLLANQPTRGLDVGAIEYVHKRLLEQRQDGAAILLISDDLEELMKLSDRIAVIFRGNIMGVFNPEDIEIDKLGLLMAGIAGEAA